MSSGIKAKADRPPEADQVDALAHVAAALSAVLVEERVSKVELAQRLGLSIEQTLGIELLLDGRSNVSVSVLASIATALERRLTIDFERVGVVPRQPQPALTLKIVEVVHSAHGGNWGKFMIAAFNSDAWRFQSAVDEGVPLLRRVGQSQERLYLIVDLQTCEGALFNLHAHGSARSDLKKRRVWTCPMFEPFLEWLYAQPDPMLVPAVVELPRASFSVYGYRRAGGSIPFGQLSHEAACAFMKGEPRWDRWEFFRDTTLSEDHPSFVASFIGCSKLPSGPSKQLVWNPSDSEWTALPEVAERDQ